LFRVPHIRYEKRSHKEAGAVFRLIDEGRGVQKLSQEEARRYEAVRPRQFPSIGLAIAAGMLTDSELASMDLKCKSCHAWCESELRQGLRDTKFNELIVEKQSQKTKKSRMHLQRLGAHIHQEAPPQPAIC
jgi:hypothetical protein